MIQAQIESTEQKIVELQEKITRYELKIAELTATINSHSASGNLEAQLWPRLDRLDHTDELKSFQKELEEYQTEIIVLKSQLAGANNNV